MTTVPKSNIHPLVWFLLGGTFLSRLALFITLPFISIYITTKMGVSPSITGIVAGLGPLCGIFSAFLMGYVSDKFGRQDVLKISLLIWAFAFLGFSFSSHVWQFALFNMIYGMSRSSFESVASALITDLTDPSLRQKVFHYRYFAINLGACIAPPIGAWLFVEHPKTSFLITATVYFIYCLALTYFLHKWHPTKKQDTIVKSSVTFSTTLSVIRNDKPLMLFLFGNVLMLLGFAQFETNFPQLLQTTFGQAGIKLFSYLTITNALTIVLLQFPINSFTKRFSLIHVIAVGFLLYGIGEAMFGVFISMKWMLYISMILFTLGEILVFSNTNYLIDQIGPKHLKGAYFGLTEIGTLGFVLGPFLGGLFLERDHGSLLFIVFGSLAAFSVLFYFVGNNFLGDRKLK